MDDDTLIGAIYAAATRDEILGTMLELLARRFRCCSATLVYLDPRHPEAAIAAGYGIAARPDVQELYRTKYAKDDPAPAAMARMRVGEIATTDRLFDAPTQASSRFLREFYHPIGLREAMGGPFANEGGRFGLLVVQRGDERSPFDDDDIVSIGRFLLHVKRAIALRDTFFRLEARAETLEAALDGITGGLLAFDRRRVLTHANAAARAILARADGLELDRAGRVRASDATVDARLQMLLNYPHIAALHEVIRVPRTGNGLAYVICAVPLQLSTGTTLSLRLSEPDVSTEGDVATTLRTALALSEPSARLTEALLKGETLMSYGKRIGISQNTVKFHLKAAFAATGCRRQADLVRIAGAVTRDIGVGP